MYTAAAGMAAQQQRLDAVSTDLANVNTTGYKHVRVAFRDLMYQDAGPGAAAQVQTGVGAAATVIGRSQAPGAQQQTGNTLDVAVSGPGFLQVKLADGRTALTRDGHLRIDAQGRLGLHTGELLEPPVTLPAGTDPGQLSISAAGRITVGRRPVGVLTLVDVPAPGGLQGGPGNTFIPARASGAVRPAPATSSIQQGVLESSNVDVADAMSAMIESQRAFELASKAIQTQDQILEIANGIRR
jgi:flagellar basal-body rod protein FlgG